MNLSSKYLFLTLILFCFNSSFSQNAQRKETLHGVWQLVESGCSLELDETTVEQLVHSGGRSYESISILELYGNRYRKSLYNGTYCRGKQIGQYNENGNIITCLNIPVISEGSFTLVSLNSLYFEGYVVQMSSSGLIEGLGLGYRHVLFDMTGNVLIWEQNLPHICTDGRGVYKSYWIPAPMS